MLNDSADFHIGKSYAFKCIWDHTLTRWSESPESSLAKILVEVSTDALQCRIECDATKLFSSGFKSDHIRQGIGSAFHTLRQINVT